MWVVRATLGDADGDWGGGVDSPGTVRVAAGGSCGAGGRTRRDKMKNKCIERVISIEYI